MTAPKHVLALLVLALGAGCDRTAEEARVAPGASREKAPAQAAALRVEYHPECDTHRLSWTASPAPA